MAQIAGAAMNDSYLVQVRAVDAVGNVSAAVTAKAVISGVGDACRGTTEGIPASCIGDDVQEDDTGDPSAILAPAAGSAFALSSATDVFTIRVAGGWTTVRRNFKSFVIGNAHDGDIYRRICRDYSDTLGYTTGFVFGDFNSCGWVKATNVADTLANATTNCDPQLRIPASDFMVAANCLPKIPGDPKCSGGTDIEIIKNVRACANISPNFPAVPVRCEGTGGRNYSVGQHVNWRYVTKGPKYKNFVLVNDPSIKPGELNWVFVPRSAFRSKLCGTKPGCGGVGS